MSSTLKSIKPLVSVIIPCYNQGRFLSSALHSLLSQTWQHWEAIVVDDGSTDDTSQVVERFQDPRVCYFYQQNNGVSAARNSGLEQARGDFVAFLDADDAWRREFLERTLVTLLNDPRLGMVYSRYQFLDDQGNLLTQIGGRALEPEAFSRVIRRGGFFPPHCALSRRSAIDKVGGFDTHHSGTADWDLWLKISSKFPVRGLGKPLAFYRLHAASMSTNAKSMHKDRLLVLAKHFGPQEGSPDLWPPEKREVYSCGYRTSAYEFLMQRDPDEAWELLAAGARIWPPLLAEVETYYEFILDDQPKGRRGQADLLDLTARARDVFSRLDILLETNQVPIAQGRVARSRAYLALAMLADQANNRQLGRKFIRSAVRHDPALLAQTQIAKRFVKLHTGLRRAKISTA